MGTELDTVGTTMADLRAYCELMAGASMLPKHIRGPADVLFAVRAAQMMGLPDMAGITGMHSILGIPTVKTSLARTLVRKAGHRMRIDTSGSIMDGSLVATCRIWRADEPDEPPHEATWTVQDAVIAKHLKPAGKGGERAFVAVKENSGWDNYPRAMVVSRAVAECVGIACPEVLYGVGVESDEEVAAQSAIPRSAVTVQRAAPAAATPAPAADAKESTLSETVTDAYRSAVLAWADAGETDALADLWREIAEEGYADEMVRVPDAWQQPCEAEAEFVPLGQLVRIANQAMNMRVKSGESREVD